MSLEKWLKRLDKKVNLKINSIIIKIDRLKKFRRYSTGAGGAILDVIEYSFGTLLTPGMMKSSTTIARVSKLEMRGQLLLTWNIKTISPRVKDNLLIKLRKIDILLLQVVLGEKLKMSGVLKGKNRQLRFHLLTRRNGARSDLKSL